MSRNCCNDCVNCEMLMEDESIVIIKQIGLSETRRVVPAVKCMRFGQYATTIVELPKSQLRDDMIWEQAVEMRREPLKKLIN